MCEDQLVGHCYKSCPDRVVSDVLHGAAVLVLNVGVAAPCSVSTQRTGMYPALEGIAALATDDLAGEAVAALVFLAAFDDAIFFAVLLYQSICRLKDFAADDGFVVICHRVLIFLAVIDMAVELRIGVGLLENHITGVFLVADHAAHRCRRPASSLFGRYAVCIQFL